MKIPKISKNIFEKYRINEDWFFNNPNSIHGVLHEYRVLTYSYLIALLEKSDLDAVCFSAIFHDIMRHNDDIDKNHGKRASDWICENLNMKNKDKIMYIVKWHVPKDSEAPEMTLELKCFKDADALDRWRIGDFNEKFLRTKSSRQLIDFSKKLYKITEEQKEIIKDCRENILIALESMDILA